MLLRCFGLLRHICSISLFLFLQTLGLNIRFDPTLSLFLFQILTISLSIKLWLSFSLSLSLSKADSLSLHTQAIPLLSLFYSLSLSVALVRFVPCEVCCPSPFVAIGKENICCCCHRSVRNLFASTTDGLTRRLYDWRLSASTTHSKVDKSFRKNFLEKIVSKISRLTDWSVLHISVSVIIDWLVGT